MRGEQHGPVFQCLAQLGAIGIVGEFNDLAVFKFDVFRQVQVVIHHVHVLVQVKGEIAVGVVLVGIQGAAGLPEAIILRGAGREVADAAVAVGVRPFQRHTKAVDGAHLPAGAVPVGALTVEVVDVAKKNDASLRCPRPCKDRNNYYP